MYTDHPNLLPSYFEDDSKSSLLGNTYVRKPLLSRQGANIEIYNDDIPETRNDGPYGSEGHILQAYHPLPGYTGNYPLIGCWLIASRAVGMGIREDKTLVTGPNAHFIPHVILD